MCCSDPRSLFRSAYLQIIYAEQCPRNNLLWRIGVSISAWKIYQNNPRSCVWKAWFACTYCSVSSNRIPLITIFSWGFYYKEGCIFKVLCRLLIYFSCHCFTPKNEWMNKSFNMHTSINQSVKPCCLALDAASKMTRSDYYSNLRRTRRIDSWNSTPPFRPVHVIEAEPVILCIQSNVVRRLNW